jgi:hypothetical protein
MNPMLVAAAVAVAAFAVYHGVLRRRQRVILPVVADDEFLREYGDREGVDPSAVLRERSYLSKLFSVPADRLRPSMTFTELQPFVEPVQFALALSDLEDDIYDVHRKAGVSHPAHGPRSVGEAIDLLLVTHEAREDA